MDDEKRNDVLNDAGAEAKVEAPAAEETKAKKKKPLMWVLVGALAVVLALVIFLPGRGGSNAGFGKDAAGASYGAFANGDTNFSYNDGIGAVQGDWDLYSVVIDGDETVIQGTGASGKLEISGSRWSMTISTDTVQTEGGDFEVVNSAVTDSGQTAYLYRFYSDTKTGYIEAILMPDYPMLCVSVSETFDSDNFFAFGR